MPKVSDEIRKEADEIMHTLERHGTKQYAPSWTWSSRIKRDRQKAAIELLVSEGKLEQIQSGTTVYRVVEKQKKPKKKRGRPKKKDVSDDN